MSDNKWQDMGLYWAWRGERLMPAVPYQKRIEYSLVEFSNGVSMRVATAVMNGNVRVPYPSGVKQVQELESWGCKVSRHA